MESWVNYYDVLEVEADASPDQIRAAFRRLCQSYHPDRVHSASDEIKKLAEEKFKEIREASDVLCDPHRRLEYDRLLAKAEASRAAEYTEWEEPSPPPPPPPPPTPPTPRASTASSVPPSPTPPQQPPSPPPPGAIRIGPLATAAGRGFLLGLRGAVIGAIVGAFLGLVTNFVIVQYELAGTTVNISFYEGWVSTVKVVAIIGFEVGLVLGVVRGIRSTKAMLIDAGARFRHGLAAAVAVNLTCWVLLALVTPNNATAPKQAERAIASTAPTVRRTIESPPAVVSVGLAAPPVAAPSPIAERISSEVEYNQRALLASLTPGTSFSGSIATKGLFPKNQGLKWTIMSVEEASRRVRIRETVQHWYDREWELPREIEGLVQGDTLQFQRYVDARGIGDDQNTVGVFRFDQHAKTLVFAKKVRPYGFDDGGEREWIIELLDRDGQLADSRPVSLDGPTEPKPLSPLESLPVPPDMLALQTDSAISFRPSGFTHDPRLFPSPSQKDRSAADKAVRRTPANSVQLVSTNSGGGSNGHSGVNPDSERAVLLSPSVVEETPESLFAKAVALEETKDPRREGEIFSLFKQAAEKGHVAAAGCLGSRYYEGLGVPRDIDEGIRWLQKGSEGRDPLADGWLGHLYRFGSGVTRDVRKALELTTRSAENGNKESMLNVAAMLRQGIGAEADQDASDRWYTKAFNAYKEEAEHRGSARAQGRIGWMYAKGQGVAKDISMAAVWFERAARGGDKDSQFHIGELEYDGFRDGSSAVGKNRSNGLKWLRAAANAGQEEAKKFLRERGESW